MVGPTAPHSDASRRTVACDNSPHGVPRTRRASSKCDECGTRVRTENRIPGIPSRRLPDPQGRVSPRERPRAGARSPRPVRSDSSLKSAQDAEARERTETIASEVSEAKAAPETPIGTSSTNTLPSSPQGLTSPSDTSAPQSPKQIDEDGETKQRNNERKLVLKQDATELQEISSPRHARQQRAKAFYHSPSSLERLSSNPCVVEFDDWVQTIPAGWDVLHDMFTRESASLSGASRAEIGSPVCATQGISKKRWIQLLMNRGYPNQASLHDIFDEIARENTHDRRGTDENESTIRFADDEIFPSQLRRFESRVMSLTSTLDVASCQSPAGRFVKFLVNKCGSSLLAWRTVLDVNGTGRIAYADFVGACRKLGFATQARAIWNNSKQDKLKPLEFHELDPKEGQNLENFAEILWDTVGLDVSRAWLAMDVLNRKCLPLAEFKQAAAKLGFHGDAKLLYKGLDLSCIGRLNEQDLEYVTKVCRVARRVGLLTASNAGALGDLITWVRRTLGGTDELIARLDIPSGKEVMFVGDFAARLTALGFDGNALQAASKISRLEGGTSIHLSNVIAHLSGQRPRDLRPASPSSRHLSHSPHAGQRGPNRLGWHDSVDNISANNEQKCKYRRDYFHRDDRDLVPMRRSESCTSISKVRSQAHSALISKSRPWDSSFGAHQDRNGKVSSCTRTYFSDCQEKPVRDERRELVKKRLFVSAERSY